MDLLNLPLPGAGMTPGSATLVVRELTDGCSSRVGLGLPA